TVIVGVDLLAGYAFMQALKARGKPPAWVALYLWHPLVVLEFAGNGHADALGILFLGLALWAWVLRKPWASGHALVLAGLVKFVPWVAVPSLLRRLRWRWLTLPLLAAALYLFFWPRGLNPLGSLDVYVKTWRANDFLFSVFVPHDAGETELERAKLIVAGCVFLVWIAAMSLRCLWYSIYAWTVGILLCLSPVVHPWYVIWLLPVLFVLPHPAWWVWSLTVMIGYWPLATYRATGVWEESLTWKAWEVSPVLALLPVQAWLERRGNGSA
ncbi:MAG TPA: hypothetical protein VFP10_13705, partial [Candidatus Eisenbacteria bacterium]|nr:hypothetical protein [Candidatus Eisenbacteria bacterium]